MHIPPFHPLSIYTTLSLLFLLHLLHLHLLHYHRATHLLEELQATLNQQEAFQVFLLLQVVLDTQVLQVKQNVLLHTTLFVYCHPKEVIFMKFSTNLLESDIYDILKLSLSYV